MINNTQKVETKPPYSKNNYEFHKPDWLNGHLGEIYSSAAESIPYFQLAAKEAISYGMEVIVVNVGKPRFTVDDAATFALGKSPLSLYELISKVSESDDTLFIVDDAVAFMAFCQENGFGAQHVVNIFKGLVQVKQNSMILANILDDSREHIPVNPPPLSLDTGGKTIRFEISRK